MTSKLNRLAGILRSDALRPTSAIFPSIDTDRIARQLSLSRKGADRGSKDQPGSDEKGRDGVEQSIIQSVEEERRKGLESYEEHKEVYTRRLGQAATVRLEIEAVAGKAEGDFRADVKESRAHLSGIAEDLKEWHAALAAFRHAHGLQRPAYPDGNSAVTAIVLLSCFASETILNGYLFAQKNELGLAGGAMVSALVSAVNIGVAAYAGYYSRLSTARSFAKKISGIAIILLWLALTLAINLAIAHFRDAVERLDLWSQAVETSLAGFRTAPLELRSIESWLLMFIGCLVALAAFLKLARLGERYPGYGKISRRYETARHDYVNALSEGLDGLRAERDEAIAELESANRLVRDTIGDAIDALYGQRVIRAHLAQFLEQCDLKANVLLRTYRDENRARRKTPAPDHFDEDFRFAEFVDADLEESHRATAEKEVEEVGRIVEAAIKSIHETYNELIDAFPDPHELTGVGVMAMPKRMSRQGDAAPGPAPLQVIMSGEGV